MKPITKLELAGVEASTNPRRSIHILIFDKYDEIGYSKTQDLIREVINNIESGKYTAVESYLRERISINEKFKPHKDKLLELTLKLESNSLEEWAVDVKSKGHSKQLIYEILSELFVFIQFNQKTENNESYTDLIADFLDRFTAWGKSYRIFSDEPDCSAS